MNAPFANSAAAFATDAARWAAVEARDPRAVGRFVYAVTSTGVFCRADCPSRRPRRDRVAFFVSPAEAGAAGFRACKRCHPERAEAGADIVARACRQIERAETMPALARLARQAGLSPSAFHRKFKKTMGITPAGYARAVRARRLRDGLPGADSVTDAMYGAGFGSPSRLYERSQALLGMTPGRYRTGAAGERIRHAVVTTSLGLLLVAATDIGVCYIALGDSKRFVTDALHKQFPRAEFVEGDAALARLVKGVAAKVEHPGRADTLPLDIRGTAFQQRVWSALRDILPGRTVTYAEVARRIGAPKAVRAVGTACGANPLSVVIPCHRVLGSDGKLHGYGWGLARKRALLAREGVATEPENEG